MLTDAPNSLAKTRMDSAAFVSGTQRPLGSHFIRRVVRPRKEWVRAIRASKCGDSDLAELFVSALEGGKALLCKGWALHNGVPGTIVPGFSPSETPVTSGAAR